MKRIVAAFLMGVAATAICGPVSAQNATEEGPALGDPIGGEISEESFNLGMRLMRASGNSQTFDELLPNIADQAKNLFIRANPQMQLGIISIVDRLALTLVPRRRELDEQLARIWASGFTDAEMQELIEFYESDTGKKFAEVYPKILAVEVATAQQWSRSVGEELTQLVSEELRQAVQSEQNALSGGTLPETPPEQAPEAPPQ